MDQQANPEPKKARVVRVADINVRFGYEGGGVELRGVDDAGEAIQIFFAPEAAKIGCGPVDPECPSCGELIE